MILYLYIYLAIHVIDKPLGHSIIYPIKTPLRVFRTVPSFWRRHFYTLSFHLVSEYRKQNPQGALIDETSSAVFLFFFLKTFLDSKQFMGTTHRYYDRWAVILSLLIGLGIQPTGNGERSFTTCWNSVLKGSPSESILCPAIVEVHSDEVQSSKECLLLFAACIQLPIL